MSNASVIQRMHVLIDEFRANALRDYEFERGIELHMDALEFIDSTAVQEARRLSADLVRAQYLDGEEGFGDPLDASVAAAEFRDFINKLPTAAK